MTRKQFCKLATMMLLSYATVSVGAQEIVSVDGRIREVYYSGSGVVEIPTASGFSTTVEFADKETVQTVVSPFGRQAHVCPKVRWERPTSYYQNYTAQNSSTNCSNTPYASLLKTNTAKASLTTTSA